MKSPPMLAARATTGLRGQGGFTILELLVALSVFGFLLIALNHGVNTGLRIWDIQTRQASRTADTDSATRLLRDLLTEIAPSPTISINPGSEPVAIAFTGKANQLSFVGTLPTGLGTELRADVTLELEENRFVLGWRPRRHEVTDAAPPTNVEAILPGVVHLDFAYWGVPAPDATPIWLAAWDGPALPKLIRVRLGFAQGDPRRWPDLIVTPQL
jgi:general secretion pathway protein J